MLAIHVYSSTSHNAHNVMHAHTHLESIEEAEKPGKHCGVVVDSQETNHPGEPKKWSQNER